MVQRRLQSGGDMTRPRCGIVISSDLLPSNGFEQYTVASTVRSGYAATKCNSDDVI